MKINIVNYGIVSINNQGDVVMSNNIKEKVVKEEKQTLSTTKFHRGNNQVEKKETESTTSPIITDVLVNSTPNKLSLTPTLIQPIAQFSFFGLNKVNKEMVNTIETWVGMKRKKVLFDSSIHQFNKQSFYLNVCGNKNVMTFVLTKDGFVFGAFHSYFPQPPNEGCKMINDPNFFVFTLINNLGIPPEKFNKKSCLETLCLDSLQMSVDSVYTVSRAFSIKQVKSTFSQYFSSFYQIEKKRGSKFFCGSVEPQHFEVERLLAIEWIN